MWHTDKMISLKQRKLFWHLIWVDKISVKCEFQTICSHIKRNHKKDLKSSVKQQLIIFMNYPPVIGTVLVLTRSTLFPTSIKALFVSPVRTIFSSLEAAPKRLLWSVTLNMTKVQSLSTLSSTPDPVSRKVNSVSTSSNMIQTLVVGSDWWEPGKILFEYWISNFHH